ncbi:MAG: hypothetical protein ACFE8Z_08440 [Candidatus Hermodarchaeota archaeon]
MSLFPRLHHEECIHFVNDKCTLHNINVDAKGDACAYFRPWKEESSSPEGIVRSPVPGAPIIVTSDISVLHKNQGGFFLLNRNPVPPQYWHGRHGQGFAPRGAGHRRGRRKIR